MHQIVNEDEGEALSWDELLRRGVVEYIDTEEEETVMICMTPEDLRDSRILQEGNVLRSPQCMIFWNFSGCRIGSGHDDDALAGMSRSRMCDSS